MAGGTRAARTIRVLLVAGALGLLSTVAIAWTSAARMDPLTCRGVVAIDGNHLQPWLLRTAGPAGQRLIWFEKGRVYSKPGVGPPGASGAAVACWSFATGTRGDPRYARADLALPPELRRRIDTPGLLWGIAVDTRGWPMPALRVLVCAPLSPDAPAIFVPEGGVLLPRRTLGLAPESLASVRLLPMMPLWPGLAANVAAFGAVWWSVLALAKTGLAAVRRGGRESRGLCPACGYDLQGSLDAGCPECGWGRAAPT
jgi:hypothetical protein